MDARPSPAPSHPVNAQPAEQLGIKIRGFLRHHVARKRNFHHSSDAHWIQQEGDLRRAAIHRAAELKAQGGKA